MKKKLFLVIAVIAFAVAIAFNVNANLSNNVEQNLALANVEALAQSESVDGTWWITFYITWHHCTRGGYLCCADYDCPF